MEQSKATTKLKKTITVMAMMMMMMMIFEEEQIEQDNQYIVEQDQKYNIQHLRTEEKDRHFSEKGCLAQNEIQKEAELIEVEEQKNHKHDRERLVTKRKDLGQKTKVCEEWNI